MLQAPLPQPPMLCPTSDHMPCGISPGDTATATFSTGTAHACVHLHPHATSFLRPIPALTLLGQHLPNGSLSTSVSAPSPPPNTLSSSHVSPVAGFMKVVWPHPPHTTTTATTAVPNQDRISCGGQRRHSTCRCPTSQAPSCSLVCHHLY